MKIGFFDSGIGGLAIMRAVTKTLPAYDYVFYGDTAHVPYGDKSEAEIVALTEAGVEYLFAQECVIVILACNTASAETLRTLQDGYLQEKYPDRRILGVIIPTIEEMVAQGAQNTLLIATARTVASQKYERELATRNIAHSSFTARPTPQLVPLLERGALNDALDAAAAVIDAEVSSREVDTVILGCTHYTLLKDALRARYENRFSIISQDEVIPRKLAEYLLRHPELESQLSQQGSVEEYFTGPVDKGMYDQMNNLGKV